MITATQLIEEQKNRNQQKVEEIARLQKQLKSSDNYLDNKLVNHFISSEEILDSEFLSETIGQQRFKKIIINLLKKTTLQKEILLQPLVLRVIECLKDEEVKKVKDSIQHSFESLSFEDKITFSLFCSGMIDIYKKYSFAEQFLVENFDFKEYSIDGTSILGTSGYNFDSLQSVIRLSMKKDDLEGAQRIAKTLFDILSTGVYKVPMVDIFESTLSRYDHIYMELKREEDTITPIVHKGRYDSFISKKESLLEQLTECVEYIAKRHPYYGVEEEEEEEIF